MLQKPSQFGGFLNPTQADIKSNAGLQHVGVKAETLVNIIQNFICLSGLSRIQQVLDESDSPSADWWKRWTHDCSTRKLGNAQPNYSPRFVIAGPAKFTIKSNAGCCANVKMAHLTLQVEPESFPPDKTIIIPEGTTGARIALECSTNLVNWTVATNGFYTGTNGAKFFRVVGERTP